jgi:hypothetical protein
LPVPSITVAPLESGRSADRGDLAVAHDDGAVVDGASGHGDGVAFRMATIVGQACAA